MSKQRFILAHATATSRAIDAIKNAPVGYVVEIRPPTKSRDQEAKYHAMIGDIAKQASFLNRKWDRESWKRLLVDDFAATMRQAGIPLEHDGDGHIMPSLSGTGFVQLGIQTRKFNKKEAAAFIEYLLAMGAENEIAWSDHTCYEE